jgi:hypothetical protein
MLNTSTLARKSRHMDQLIRKILKTKLQPNKKKKHDDSLQAVCGNLTTIP